MIERADDSARDPPDRPVEALPRGPCRRSACASTSGPGEFFSMLGPSGCGKTTTLRMIGGFEQPTLGRIELRGRDVTADPPDKRPVNMVFQNYALFPHLDVGDNIAFGLRRRKVEPGEIRRRVGEALDLVHLAGYEKRRPNQLSGGQQQRVALARALVNRPNVLLLDEPLGALDLKLRKQLQVELKRVQAEVGITFVYVTHDQEEALTMSDRIAVMNRGRVEQLGTPEELYERPTTRFVADFIGTTNLLTGTVESVDAEHAIVRLASAEPCVVGRADLVVGRSIELSIRPESVELRPPGGTSYSAGPHRRDRRTGRVPRRQRPVPRPLQRRAGDHRPRAEDRERASRSAAPSTSRWDAGRGARPRRRSGSGGGSGMSERYDGSTIDLEKALVRYMVERQHQPARAARADRQGRLGGRPRADHRGVHGGVARRAPRRPRAPLAPSTGAAPTASPSADAGPLARGRAVHLQLDRLPRRRGHRVVRGEVRHQGDPELLLEHRGGVREARRRRRRATT